MQCEGCSRHSDEFSINQHNRNRRDDAESIKNLFHGINKSCAPLQKEMKHSSSSSSTTPISLSNNKFPAINLHRECVADPVSFKKKKNQREFEFAIDANLCVKFSFHLALMNLAEKVIEILLDFLMNFIFLLFSPPPFYRSLKGLPLPPPVSPWGNLKFQLAEYARHENGKSWNGFLRLVGDFVLRNSTRSRNSRSLPRT